MYYLKSYKAWDKWKSQTWIQDVDSDMNTNLDIDTIEELLLGSVAGWTMDLRPL